MMADLVIFMEVFVYIVVGFCLAFYGLYNGVADPNAPPAADGGSESSKGLSSEFFSGKLLFV